MSKLFVFFQRFLDNWCYRISFTCIFGTLEPNISETFLTFLYSKNEVYRNSLKNIWVAI